MKCKYCKDELVEEGDFLYIDAYEGRGFCGIPCNLKYLEREINKLKTKKRGSANK